MGACSQVEVECQGWFQGWPPSNDGTPRVDSRDLDLTLGLFFKEELYRQAYGAGGFSCGRRGLGEEVQRRSLLPLLPKHTLKRDTVNCFRAVSAKRPNHRLFVAPLAVNTQREEGANSLNRDTEGRAQDHEKQTPLTNALQAEKIDESRGHLLTNSKTPFVVRVRMMLTTPSNNLCDPRMCNFHAMFINVIPLREQLL